MGGMEIAEHLDALERDGALLADAAGAAGLTAPVPACPGWQVKDLVRHQAYVHQWAARHVSERSPQIIDEVTEADVLAGGPPDGELLAAYRGGHAPNTVDNFGACHPPCRLCRGGRRRWLLVPGPGCGGGW